ncbi:MAG: hypothetical protein JHC88_11345 [Niveispirillum sp.]|nr:hypothetical protein [Niveispirillum sp.]
MADTGGGGVLAAAGLEAFQPGAMLAGVVVNGLYALASQWHRHARGQTIEDSFQGVLDRLTGYRLGPNADILRAMLAAQGKAAVNVVDDYVRSPDYSKATDRFVCDRVRAIAENLIGYSSKALERDLLDLIPNLPKHTAAIFYHRTTVDEASVFLGYMVVRVNTDVLTVPEGLRAWFRDGDRWSTAYRGHFVQAILTQDRTNRAVMLELALTVITNSNQAAAISENILTKLDEKASKCQLTELANAWDEGLAQVRSQLNHIAATTIHMKETTTRTDAKVDSILAWVSQDKTIANQKIAELSSILKAERAAILGLLHSLIGKKVPADRIMEYLPLAREKLAEVHKELEHLRRISRDVPEIAIDVIAAEAALTRNGMIDLVDAENRLAQALACYQKTVNVDPARDLEVLTGLDIARAAIAQARGQPREAATLYGLAADRLIRPEAAWPVDIWRKQVQALYDADILFPDQDVLIESIEILERRILPTLSPHSLAWAKAQHDLGILLLRLGKGQGENSGILQPLLQAIAAFRAALEVCTQDGTPAAWAEIQDALGSALTCLAVRQGKIDERDSLEQAIAAFHAALKVRTPETMFDDWVITQTNLSDALLALGENLGKEEGKKKLEQSLAVCEETLGVMSPSTTPTVWARMQNTLGSVLKVLATHQKESAVISILATRQQESTAITMLRRAAASHLEALKMQSRDIEPVAWAMTIKKHGSALIALARLQSIHSGEEPRLQAIASFQQALEVLPRNAAPIDYALIEAELGKALFDNGYLFQDYKQEVSGIMALYRAKSVFQSNRMIYEIQRVDEYLGKASRWKKDEALRKLAGK